MDKNAIKKYAVWARRELIARVSQKALQYGISETDFGDAEADSINGVVLSAREKSQRSSLIAKIRKDGYQQAMEEAAYTWFNRFTALRYMEVNAYLPSHVRVFTNDQNEFKPQIIDEAINLEIDGLDLDKVYEYKDANKTEELYKYLLITQCNDLGKILPGMFKKISDYTELLFPDNLLREGSVIEQMISLIPEEDWNDQVQIIGWLYQDYNTEQNELVYDGSMSKNKIPKELLSAATTMFTPDWSVRYMVENSLGKLWLRNHPNEELKLNWKYYIDNDAERVKSDIDIKPEEIKCLDPCMGSGHILVYMFDVLIQIYESYGYGSREAAGMILENNLYGLDIDDRAAQLAYFSVMMKARQYDRRIFTRDINPHVYSIVESNDIDNVALEYFINGNEKIKIDIETIISELYDAKEYGSILNISIKDFTSLYARIYETRDEFSLYQHIIENKIFPLIKVAEVLSRKYDVCCTNPPYLGSSRFSAKLLDFVNKNYANEKSDLSMVMYRHSVDDFTKNNGYTAFITTSSWFFLSSFEKLRSYIISNYQFDTIVDYGTELFDGKVGHNPIVSWVTEKSSPHNDVVAIRLVDYCYSRRDEKEPEFFNDQNRYIANQKNFSKIPGSPVAYWVSENFFRIFENSSLLNEYSVIFEGLKTRDKEKFVRLWFEIGDEKWKPYSKGGSFRRWYGNKEYVVKWGEDGTEIRNFKKSSGSNFKYYYRPTVTYSALTSYKFSGRYLENSFFGGGGGGITNTELVKYILGYVNSKVYHYIINAISPTLNFEVGQIGSQPFILNKLQQSKIEEVVQDNISLSKTDWDSFETSWDFVKHPFLVMNEKQKETHNEIVNRIEYSYGLWDAFTKIQFQILKHNEEELNRIFIDIYGLQDELTPEVEDKDVTVRKADLTRDIKSFISYAVGCMFGRYSLDVDGLAFAGGEWDNTKYKSFIPTEHNIIPISDDEYFKDDITERFISFVKTVYGEETLEENLKFIADALGGKGSPREIIRKYFINDFFADHCKIYQKRPIYWLFDSGKKNGFKALIYMHRYQPDTIARIRTDYVHEQQNRYRTAISDIEQRMSAASTSERVKLTKELRKLNEQADELLAYEEKIHHLADQMISIDLDDGVKNNYEIFKDVLAKIK